ncbi:hypothetical protein MMC07_009725 [Pseudocyphellaria aurata]|nr:hypothetical protein [Pseudocyphellaria aurata]
MAQSTLRKSQLIAFTNTAAGHDGVLSDVSGTAVIKPCKQAEIRFYESTAAHPEFAEYIPKFMGTLSLLAPDTSTLAATAALSQASALDQQSLTLPHSQDAMPVEKAWAPSGGGKINTETAIVLENVVNHYQKPNVLDVKLGARLWADDAPHAKREKLDKNAEETTSKALGIRIAGMRIWHGHESTDDSGPLLDGYRVYDKYYGRLLTPETVRQGFEHFFRISKRDGPTKRVKRVIRRCVEDLEGLQRALEKEESRMYSSSLLFVYEGDSAALQQAFISEKELLDSLEEDATNLGHDSNDIHTFHGDIPFDQSYRPPHGHDIPTTPPLEPSLEDEEDEPPVIPPIQAVKLIDFAHAEWTPGQGPDENMLHGIRTVIRLLRELLQW